MAGAFRALRPIVLASASPRRLELLGSLGLEFEVVPSDVEELSAPGRCPCETPDTFAIRLARAKALDIAVSRPDAVVIGADTIVVSDDMILGKPTDRDQALEMLRSLSGRWHTVITACCVVLPERATPVEFHVKTRVHMPLRSDAELTAYAATGEPDDKAGAYAIQSLGAFLVDEIQGSYTNVVGLPLTEVVEVLGTWGVMVPTER